MMPASIQHGESARWSSIGLAVDHNGAGAAQLNIFTCDTLPFRFRTRPSDCLLVKSGLSVSHQYQTRPVPLADERASIVLLFDSCSIFQVLGSCEHCVRQYTQLGSSFYNL